MARTRLPPHEVADLGAGAGGRVADRVGGRADAGARAQMRARFARERPLDGVRIAACLHVTAETANLVRDAAAGGARAALCSANPLSTQDDVAAALVCEHGIEVRARRGEERRDVRAACAGAARGGRPQITIDDGADLLVTAHALGGEALGELIGGTEETATGLVRLRRLEERGELRCPVLAVNEARTERALNDRHGTGQSALDGIVRATNVLLAGNTLVVSATAGPARASPSAPAAPAPR